MNHTCRKKLKYNESGCEILSSDDKRVIKHAQECLR